MRFFFFVMAVFVGFVGSAFAQDGGVKSPEACIDASVIGGEDADMLIGRLVGMFSDMPCERGKPRVRVTSRIRDDNGVLRMDFVLPDGINDTARGLDKWQVFRYVSDSVRERLGRQQEQQEKKVAAAVGLNVGHPFPATPQLARLEPAAAEEPIRQQPTTATREPENRAARLCFDISSLSMADQKMFRPWLESMFRNEPCSEPVFRSVGEREVREVLQFKEDKGATRVSTIMFWGCWLDSPYNVTLSGEGTYLITKFVEEVRIMKQYAASRCGHRK